MDFTITDEQRALLEDDPAAHLRTVERLIDDELVRHPRQLGGSLHGTGDGAGGWAGRAGTG